jgi:hypothetical protein
MRPAGVVVSIASVIERKPAPASPIRSMICRALVQIAGAGKRPVLCCDDALDGGA